MTFNGKRGAVALVGAAVAAVLLGLPTASSAAVFGVNLVVNGDAESGMGSSDGGIVPVPGFDTTGQFTAVRYDAGGGFPVAGDPGVAQGGSNFFAGGPTSASSSGSQIIDISPGASTIDLGTARYDLSALLGGYASQDDNAVLSVNFLGSTSGILGTAAIGPVFAADRGDMTGFLARSNDGFVPVGTRSISLLLQLTRTAGSYDDGYADNLSLVLTGGAAPGVPEPATWAMMIGGFALTGFAARRRRIMIPA